MISVLKGVAEPMRALMLLLTLSLLSVGNAGADGENNPSWQNMSLAELKMLQDKGTPPEYDQLFIDYVRNFDFPELTDFKEIQSNEIRLALVKDQIIEQMKTRVDAIEANETILMLWSGKVKFNNYDVTTNAFELKSPYNKFWGLKHSDSDLSKNNEKAVGFLRDQTAIFENPDAVNYFNMPIESAAEFLDDIPGAKEDVSKQKREVQLQLFVTPTQFLQRKDFGSVVKYRIVGYRAYGIHNKFEGKYLGERFDEGVLEKIQPETIKSDSVDSEEIEKT